MDIKIVENASSWLLSGGKVNVNFHFDDKDPKNQTGCIANVAEFSLTPDVARELAAQIISAADRADAELQKAFDEADYGADQYVPEKSFDDRIVEILEVIDKRLAALEARPQILPPTFVPIQPYQPYPNTGTAPWPNGYPYITHISYGPGFQLGNDSTV